MTELKALGIACSPRPGGNSDELLRRALSLLEERGFSTTFVALRDLRIEHCRSCRKCVLRGKCVIDDDMHLLATELLSSHVVLISTPVHFDNVSSLAKTFMDRTWWLRGKLRYRVGGAIVVGRGYGLDTAISVIHSFMLKHGMVICHRGVRCVAFEKGEALRDSKALKDLEDLIESISYVARALWARNGV